MRQMTFTCFQKKKVSAFYLFFFPITYGVRKHDNKSVLVRHLVNDCFSTWVLRRSNNVRLRLDTQTDTTTIPKELSCWGALYQGIQRPINCSCAWSDAVSTDHVQHPNTLQGRVGVRCQAEPTVLQQGLEAVLPVNGNQGTNRLGHFLLYFSILFLHTVLSPVDWKNWCNCCRNAFRQTPIKRNCCSSRRGFRGYYVLCVFDFIKTSSLIYFNKHY